jgi:hypothetical protein
MKGVKGAVRNANGLDTRSASRQVTHAAGAQSSCRSQPRRLVRVVCRMNKCGFARFMLNRLCVNHLEQLVVSRSDLALVIQQRFAGPDIVRRARVGGQKIETRLSVMKGRSHQNECLTFHRSRSRKIARQHLELETEDHVVRFCDLDIGLIDTQGWFSRFAPPRDGSANRAEPANSNLSTIIPVQNVEHHSG